MKHAAEPRFDMSRLFDLKHKIYIVTILLSYKKGTP